MFVIVDTTMVAVLLYIFSSVLCFTLADACRPCYRRTLPVRVNTTTNYCEAAMQIIKDKTLL